MAKWGQEDVFQGMKYDADQKVRDYCLNIKKNKTGI
jgi:hypothetical protein